MAGRCKGELFQSGGELLADKMVARVYESAREYRRAASARQIQIDRNASQERKTIMKICVTGGHGFIGRVACQWLVSAGHTVVVLDSAKPPQPHPWTTASFLGDVRDKASCLDAFRGCDRVLHLAAAHRDFGISEAEYFDVNQHGTTVVCEAMVVTGIRDLCLYSSVAVYGSAADPRSEATTPKPLSPYGKSKLAAEMVAVQWAHEANCCLWPGKHGKYVFADSPN